MISIITPCLNSARYIGEAIESVLTQSYPYMEHIVADGGSTDGTLPILSRYSHLKVLSSPDHGMYDALNRALQIAQGDFIGTLNSDDCYAAEVFRSVIEAFRDDNVMAVRGAAVMFRDAELAEDKLTPMGTDLLFQSIWGNPSINAWFFRRSVFAQIGRFNATYRVAGDREFMLRFAFSGLKYADTERLVYRYRMHPRSMTFGGGEEIWETILREHNRMTGYYLCKPGLSSRARQWLKRARTRDTLNGAIHAIRQGDLRKVMLQAVAGTRYDPVWPARLAKRAIYLVALKCGYRELAGRH